ncbi:MAG: mechanosensitive ion channel [Fimbriimonadaceae bacterium]|nr:mechanosensitive ion channel [Fimbriimonadaceae bacterium]
MESLTIGFNNVLQQLGEWAPRVLLGLVLVFGGWIVAKLVQRAFVAVSKKLGLDKPFEAKAGADAVLPESQRPSVLVGLFAFWVVMLFVVVGFFSALNLTMVAEPLTEMLNRVTSGIPNLLGALVLLGIGWIIASLARTGIVRLFDRFGVDHRLQNLKLMSAEMAEKRRFSQIVGLLGYGLVILLFAQSAFELVGLTLVASTAQGLVDSAVGILPNLLSAALIMFVSFLLASIVRPIIQGFLQSSGIDKHSEQFGLTDDPDSKQPSKLSELIANVVFWLMLLFAVPAVLDQLELTPIVEPLRAAWDKVFLALPNIGAAFLLVLATYFAIKIFSPIVRAMLQNFGVDSLLGKIGLADLQSKVEDGTVKMSPSEWATKAIALIVALIVTQEVMHILGMVYLAEMVQSIVNYIPNVLVAAIIVGFAIKLGSTLGDIAQASAAGLGADTSKTVNGVVRVSVLVFGGSVALAQLGVGGEVVQGTMIVIAAGIALAFAISVGLGAKPAVEKMIERKFNP